ncbi:MAG TPA: alcohol dehydrogenase catalytic domain-containing protein [Solirubrobacteraceae bacterium]|nr:alcohol dehydrogenase catalytic domain-containing protein [Solirubrobacteraceae bacterium]
MAPSGNPKPHHPHGWLRHYAGMLAPDSLAATRLTLERDAAKRVGRSTRVLAARATRPVRRRQRRMRSLLASPGGRIAWRSISAPSAPGPDAAVVRPLAAATCDMDCPVMLGATQIPLPLHLGHECVAEVLRVGSRVRSVAPGDRVIVPFQINCGTCDQCRAARTGSCTSVPPVSMYGFGFAGGHWGGAYAEELAVPYADAMLVALPDGIDAEAAVSVADNVCDAYRHIGPHLPPLLQEAGDARVLVVATLGKRSRFTPSVPLYTGLIALAMGAREVVLADARPHVREHAAGLGMHAVTPRELRKLDPFPLVADVSVDGLQTALAGTAPDGVCSSSGGLHRQARIPILSMYVRNATLTVARTHARAVMPHVLELMQSGGLKPERVTTRTERLDDAPAVLGEHIRDPRSIKTVFVA